MKNLLKNGRENKGFTTRELAKTVLIDQALISKFENGSRIPTKDQILKLAIALDINKEELLSKWLKNKIVANFGVDKTALNAFTEILKDNNFFVSNSNEPKIDSILEEMEKLKDKLQQLK